MVIKLSQGSNNRVVFGTTICNKCLLLINATSIFFLAYLNVSDINIIVVDWGTAANVNYILASYNVAMVGQLLTQFLNFLIEMGVSMDDVHLIGHSLGAHVVGIAGAYVKKGPIDTITGS